MVIVTEAMEATNPNMEEDTKLNMEVVMAMSLPCMVVMSSLLTEDMSHRLMEVTRLPCMEDMKRRLMEATHPTEVMEDRVTEVTVVIRAIPDMVMKSHLTEDMNLLMEAINHLTDLILPVQQAKKKASQKQTLTYTSSVLTTPMNFFNHDHEYTSSELI